MRKVNVHTIQMDREVLNDARSLINRPIALLGFALLLVAAQVCARDPWALEARVGDFEFNIPEGWKRTDTANGPALVPLDLAQGAVTLIA